MVETKKAGLSGEETIVLGIASALTAMIISKLAGKVAVAVAGSPEESEDEMYEQIYDKIDNAPYRGRAAVGRTFVPDKSAAMGYVKNAIKSLESAEKVTDCGVCKKKIVSAITAVKTESALIARTEAKYEIINALKSEGKIPQKAGWAQLNPVQRAFVTKKAEELIKNGK